MSRDVTRNYLSVVQRFGVVSDQGYVSIGQTLTQVPHALLLHAPLIVLKGQLK